MDRARIGTFRNSGFFETAVDVNNGTSSSFLRDTFKIDPQGGESVIFSKTSRRYGGAKKAGETHDNGTLEFEAYLGTGASLLDAMTTFNQIMAAVDSTATNYFFEWRPDGLSQSVYYELRGLGPYEPMYRWIEVQGTKRLHVKFSFQIAPLALGAPMDVFEDFALRGSALYTNQVTNPSFEIDTSNWVATTSTGITSTLVRSTAWASEGAASGRHQVTANTGGVLTVDSQFGTNTGNYLPVTPGETWTVTAVVNVAVNSSTGIYARLQFRNGAGASIAGSITGTQLTGTGVKTVTVTGVVPVGAAFLSPRVGITTVSTELVDFSVDQMTAVKTGDTISPFTGDSDRGHWTGTPQTSTSQLYSAGALDDWTFDTGSGTLGSADGQLVPADTTVKRLYHSARGYTLGDVQATMKFTTGASVGATLIPSIIYRIDANNYLRMGQPGSAGLDIYKVVGGGAPVQLAHAAGFVAAANTTYWIRGRIEGNMVYAEVYSQPPGPGVATAGSISVQLTGSDATLFGTGAQGYAGINIAAAGTDWRYDDVVIEPFTYATRALPEDMVLRGIPGTAPARVDVKTTDMGAQAPNWALIAWGALPQIYNMVWNGGMEMGALTGSGGGWSVAAVTNINGAATSLNQDNSNPKYGSWSGQLVTPATAQTGANFRIFKLFKRGVTYTVGAWVRSAAGTTPVSIRLGNAAANDIAASSNTALSPSWQFITTTWTPTADRTDAHVGIRIEAATATTFNIDGVVVYEGVVAPTLGQHNQGVGGFPPLGVIEAENAHMDTSNFVVTADAAVGRLDADLQWTPAAGGPRTARSAVVVDPSLITADDFSDSVSVEVFARVSMPGVSAQTATTLMLWAEPITTGAGTIYSAEYGTTGKVVVQPSGTTAQWRMIRLGTLTFPIDANNPLPWKLKVDMTTATVSSGQVWKIDYLLLHPVRQRALSPTGIVLDSTYPKFATVSLMKLTRSNLSGAAGPVQIGSPLVSMVGLGGQQIEFTPGNVLAYVKFSELVPDDPTSNASSEVLAHSSYVHFAVWPRYHLARGS